MATELAILINATNRASGPIRDVIGDMQRLERQGGLVTRGMSGLQSALGTALKAGAIAAGAGLAAVGTALGVAANSAADFQQTLSGIQAVSGATAAQMGSVADVALRLGKDTAFSAAEAAQGIEMLARNGLGVAEILGGAADATVYLAAAAKTDLATAADIATDAMASFGLTAQDMTPAIDGIAGVTANSKFNINDYQLALAQAGGVASAVGVEFEDFNTAVAAIAPSFASGSDAGTSYKTFLQRLVPDTKPARQAMAELGLLTEEGSSKFFDATGNLRSMSEVSGLLAGALNGLTEEQRNLALQTIFGTDAMRAAASLARIGEEEFNRLADAIGSVSAAQQAVTRMDNLRGSLEELGGTIETVGIRFGSDLLEPLQIVTDWITNRLNTALLETDFPGWTAFWEGAATTLRTFFAEVDGGASVLSALRTALGEILPQSALDRIDGAVAAFYAFREGVGAVVSAIDNLTQPIQDFVAEWVELRDVVVAAALVIGVSVLGALGGALGALGGIAAAAAAPLLVLAGLTAAVAVLRNAWERDWAGIQSVVTGVANVIKDEWSAVWEALGEGDTGPLLAALTRIKGVIGLWLIARKNQIKAAVQGWWDQFTDTDFGTALVDALNNAFALAEETINGLLDWSGYTVTLPEIDPGDLFSSTGITIGGEEGTFSLSVVPRPIADLFNGELSLKSFLTPIGILAAFSVAKKFTLLPYLTPIAISLAFIGPLAVGLYSILPRSIKDAFNGEVSLSKADGFLAKGSIKDAFKGDISLTDDGFLGKANIKDAFKGSVQLGLDGYLSKTSVKDAFNSTVQLDRDGFLTKVDIGKAFSGKVKLDKESGYLSEFNLGEVVASKLTIKDQKVQVDLDFGSFELPNLEQLGPKVYGAVAGGLGRAFFWFTDLMNGWTFEIDINDVVTGTIDFVEDGFVSKMQIGDLIEGELSVFGETGFLQKVKIGDFFEGSLEIDPSAEGSILRKVKIGEVIEGSVEIFGDGGILRKVKIGEFIEGSLKAFGEDGILAKVNIRDVVEGSLEAFGENGFLVKVSITDVFEGSIDLTSFPVIKLKIGDLIDGTLDIGRFLRGDASNDMFPDSTGIINGGPPALGYDLNEVRFRLNLLSDGTMGQYLEQLIDGVPDTLKIPIDFELKESFDDISSLIPEGDRVVEVDIQPKGGVKGGKGGMASLIPPDDRTVDVEINAVQPGGGKLSSLKDLLGKGADLEIPTPDWLSDLTGFDWPSLDLAELTSFDWPDLQWLPTLTGYQWPDLSWLSTLTSYRFPDLQWLPTLTGFRWPNNPWLPGLLGWRPATPSWLPALLSYQMPKPYWWGTEAGYIRQPSWWGTTAGTVTQRVETVSVASTARTLRTQGRTSY